MPRVSSAPEDAFHFKGSFADGWGEVVEAKALVFQYPPTKEAKNNRPAGSQDPPALVAALMIQRHSDGDGTKTPQEPEEVLLSIQRPDKMTGELSACHPGKFPDGDVDADPEDMGAALGAEGDTLFAMQDGYQLNDKCKWMTFTASLQEKGFKPAILKRTYFPDLVGLRAYFTTVVKKGQGVGGDDSSVFVVKEIKQFPYEKKAGATAAASAKGKGAAAATKTTAPAKAAAAATAAAPAKAEANGAAGSLSAEDIATAIITDTLAPSQVGATFPSVAKLKVAAFMSINKHKPAVDPSLKKAVQEQLGDVDWLTAIGEATGTFTVDDEGAVQFA
jgi:hypothetical protein